MDTKLKSLYKHTLAFSSFLKSSGPRVAFLTSKDDLLEFLVPVLLTVGFFCKRMTKI